MACDLIANMIEIAGFRLVEGRLLVKDQGERQIVVSAEDGGLATEDDFLVVVYDGRFTESPGATELLTLTLQDVGEAPASGLSPIDEALEQARDRAAA